MIIKECEFCKKKIETKFSIKRFCNPLCQARNYRNQPGIKEKCRQWSKNYRKRHPEWKERHRILAVTRHREKRAEYWKEYGKRPEVRARIREKEKLRRKTDMYYAISDRLRRSLRHALTKYSKTGKIMNSKKYGLDWREIIESLKPFPKNLKDYEIDHIIPLRTFNLNDTKEIKNKIIIK